MKGEDILDALEHIDPALIEDANTPVVKREKHWLAAIAAVLVLVIGIRLLWIKLDNISPTSNTQPVMDFTPTAQMLGDMFPDTDSNDSATKYYKLYWDYTLADLHIQSFSHKDTLTIYSTKIPIVDGEKFSLYVDNYLPKLSSLLGIPTPEYHVVYTGQNTIEATASGCQIPGLDFSATYSGSPVAFANSVSFRVSSSGSTLPIDHKDVYFSVNDSDPMIQQKLADTIAYMNGCFGTNYTEMKIERYDRFNQTFVYLFANEESKPPADLVHIRNIPASEYTLLIFGKPIGSNKDNLYLQNVEIHKMIIPLHEHYIPLGNTKMLTVEEAEILLEKGYFFANGHFCPRCAGTGPEIDFSDYDGLELIYLHGENGIVVPFYAFYKELDSIGVAVVYVPAIEVDGLDEYFIQQMQKHK